MEKWIKVPVLFKIDRETLNRLDTAANELGHSRSHFIRNAITRRIVEYEARERKVILTLRDQTPSPSEERA